MAMVKDDILDLSVGKVPMLKVLLLYISGIVSASWITSAIRPSYCLLLMGIVLLAYIFLSYFCKFQQKIVFTICFSLFVISYGFYNYSSLQKQHDSSHYSHGSAIQYVGIIDDEPVAKEKTVRFPVRLMQAVDSSQVQQVTGKIMLTILRDSMAPYEYQYGDQLIFSNKLKDVNPHFNPKEFDYKSYLANKGIFQQCLIKSTELKLLEHGQGNALIAYSLQLRAKLITKFRKYISDDEAFNVAVALIFGYRSQIDQSTIAAFTNTGTIHVLSVSGLHVSLVFVLLNWVLKWMDRFRYGKLLKSIAILFAIWSYVVLTGMSPPILRAGIMISFFVSSLLLNRKQIPLNTLAASAFFILLFAPQYLFDVGFQLSYFAILGIILLYPILKHYYLTSNKWINYVLEYVYVSLAAQLFTLPLTLFYFGQFPNYFLIANLFIALPSTFVMYAGVVLTLLNVEFINQLSGFALEWGLIFMMRGLYAIENLPLANVQGISWNWIQMLILLIGIAALLVALNYKMAKSVLLILSAICTLSLFGGMQVYMKSKHSGLTFYNLRSELAISLIDKSNVFLCSNLDSLQHNTLQYSVLPHLRQYTSNEDIVFHPLPYDDSERQNQLIQVGKFSILILEQRITELPEKVDFVLWRKNNYTDIDAVLSQYTKAVIVMDGSNSDKTIDRLRELAASNSNRLYILKNNFAYVWEEE